MLFLFLLVCGELTCFKIAMELCGGGAGNDLYQVLDRPVSEHVIGYVTRECLRVFYSVLSFVAKCVDLIFV